MKIAANYVPATDMYVAAYANNGLEGSISSRNGSTLSERVKKELGVEIDYNWDTRTFSVPEENQFD